MIDSLLSCGLRIERYAPQANQWHLLLFFYLYKRLVPELAVL